MSHFYDDSDFAYDKYWIDRSYEHQSEVTAVKTLLGRRKFSHSTDIGGGYGRLTQLLVKCSKRVVLVEPSRKQRLLAKKYLTDRVEIRPGFAEKTGLAKKSCDLAVMIRVLHHLPNPSPALAEVNKILQPNGLLILEFANSTNFKAKLKSFFKRQPILPIPVEKRNPTNIKNQTIPFVNHHPHSIIKNLSRHGFKVLKVLSVSNFRFNLIKRFIPITILNALEKVCQKYLSNVYFGPSIFILARKVDNKQTL